MDFVRQLLTVFPGLTSGRLYAMAGAVGEHANDLEAWADLQNYGSAVEMRDHIQQLREAAQILGLLANVLEEVEATGGVETRIMD